MLIVHAECVTYICKTMSNLDTFELEIQIVANE